MWFGASNVCVSGVADPLPKRHTSRICEGHEDLLINFEDLLGEIGHWGGGTSPLSPLSE